MSSQNAAYPVLTNGIDDHEKIVSGRKVYYELTGKILPDSGLSFVPDKSEVRLVPYNEGEEITTATVKDDGTFILKVEVKGNGAYELKYKSFKLPLLLAITEPFYKVVIKCGEKQEIKSIKITGSRENDAYRTFRRTSLGFKDALRDLKRENGENEQNCLVKYRKLCASQNEVMEYLKQGYKGTFVANVLANLGEVPTLNGKGSALSQLQAGFFGDAAFIDSTLYRTPDLNNKMSCYLDYIADTSANARLDFINHILDKTKGNHTAQKNLLTGLFNNFLDDYREPYITSLIAWANRMPSINESQPVLSAKLKLVANVLPGMPAPDVTGENLNQQTQTLLGTAKTNKLTLLIFWESDCPHCRKAMPDLIRLYKQYHSRGLEVFAASLDSDKSKWKLFIDYNHLAWTNIVLPEKSSAHADYFIQYTPTVVLIDGTGHILRRFISVEGLENAISSILDK